MRTLEHRRHSLRAPSGHLSPQGVRLARALGPSLPAFDLVVTSPRTRAVETAVALGFAVDDTDDALAEWPDDLSDAVERGGFAGAAAWLAQPGNADAVKGYRRVMLDALRAVPDGGHGLIVSHLGVVEACVCAVLSSSLDPAALGGCVGVLEGVRLTFEADRLTRAERCAAVP